MHIIISMFDMFLGHLEMGINNYLPCFSRPFPHTYVACGCFSTGVGAAVGGFIGGVLLTGASAGVVAVAVFCRVKRELTAMSRCVSKSYQHTPHIQVHTQCYAHI